MWAGAGVGGLRTPARCLDSDRAYPARGGPKPGYPSAALRRDRSLQLTLVHARAALDVQPLRLVVELLLGLALRAIGARALPASARRRRAARGAARPAPRLARTGTVLLDGASGHLAGARRRGAAFAGASLDLLVLPGTLRALLDATRRHTNHSLGEGQIGLLLASLGAPSRLRYPARLPPNGGLPRP